LGADRASAGTAMGPRWRLAALWTSQAARAGADALLRLFAVLLATGGSPAQRESAWHLVMALFMLPCVLLAPVNGALGNSLPRRGLLVGAALYALALALAFGLIGHAWMTGVALIALGSAVYVPARLALLPAAALETCLPLARVTALIEGGAVLAIAAGMITAVELAGMAGPAGIPLTVWVLWGLCALCLLTALPVRFAGDVSRTEAPAAALRGFFSDARRLMAAPHARTALAGVALLRGIVTVSVGALIAAVLSRQPGTADAFHTLLTVALLSMAGAALGSFLAGSLPARVGKLPLVPMGATVMALALAWLAQAPGVPMALCVAVGMMGGLVNVPLLVAYQQATPPDARGNAMAILNTTGYLSTTLMSLAMAGLSAAGVLSASGQLTCVALLAGLAAALAWRMPITPTLAKDRPNS
jgi:hypothetical protein